MNKRFDTSDRIIWAGEHAQAIMNGLAMSSLVRAVAGSTSPAYVQARWHTVELVVAPGSQDPVHLPLAEADPETPLLASVIPRFKNKAAIVKVGRELPEIRNSYGSEYGGARVTVAYTYNDTTHVGDIPGEISRVYTQSPNMYSAAMRAGRSEFGAAIGVWLMKERVFVLPPSCIVAENNVPVDVLPQRYPGIRLF